MSNPPLLPERAGQAAPAELLLSRRGLAQALAASGGGAEEHRCARQIAGVRAIQFGVGQFGVGQFGVGQFGVGQFGVGQFGVGKRATVVHFHGGGFRQGQPEMVAQYAAALALGASVTVLCPAYRLAPEHPFPAGLNDGLRMLVALAAEPPKRLILSGDSAGGGLAASLALLCAEREIEVAGVVLHSPWLDLTVSNACYEANRTRDPLFSRASAMEARQLYLQGHPTDDPLASPLFADLSRFPPTFVSIGKGEVLLGDALSLKERLQAAGRPGEFCQVEGMEHVAVTRSLDLPGAREVLARTISFVARLS